MSARLANAAVAGLALLVAGAPASRAPRALALSSQPAVTTIYPVKDPVGLIVTSGGWPYCEQLRPVARRTRYTLLCGRYASDGYVGPGLRSERHLDWGNPAYLARFAEIVAGVHRRVGGQLVLMGVSYSGFGVATLAAHHPALRPDRLIVIDSYFDLVVRRRLLPDWHETALEIDDEVRSSPTSLRQRSADARMLARLMRSGTDLTVIWSVSDDERRRFNGATCSREASAATLARASLLLGRAIPAWVTRNKHGGDLWQYGVSIVRGSNPGTKVVFRSGSIPTRSFCHS